MSDNIPLCILQAEINHVGQSIRIASANINDAICSFDDDDRHRHENVALKAIKQSIDNLQAALNTFKDD